MSEQARGGGEEGWRQEGGIMMCTSGSTVCVYVCVHAHMCAFVHVTKYSPVLCIMLLVCVCFHSWPIDVLFPKEDYFILSIP